jgi:glycerol-3-phosphate acyltransferase PlsY
MLTSTLLIAGAYLWGAIPSAYLVARYLRGIDIRRHGSGNMGATNVMNHVGKLSGWLLGTFDCLAKGSLPVFVGGLLDVGMDVRVGAGLAVIAGHNWSPYVRFTGGRGVATAVGVVFGLFMWQEFLIVTVMMGAIGRLLFRDTGFWTLVAMIALPPLAFLFNRPAEVVYMAIGIAALLMLKRLTGNWDMPPPGHRILGVLVNRALWDRDIRQKASPPERMGGSVPKARLDVQP